MYPKNMGFSGLEEWPSCTRKQGGRPCESFRVHALSQNAHRKAGQRLGPGIITFHFASSSLGLLKKPAAV